MKNFLDRRVVRPASLPTAATRGLDLSDGSRYQRNGDSAHRSSEHLIVTGALALDQDESGRCRLVETIRDPQNSERLAFLDWRDGKYSIVPQVEYMGRIYAPPSENAGLVSHLTLPRGIRPCGELNELLSDLRKTFVEFVEISNRDILLLQSYILADWFPDLFESVPYLWLIGPPGSAKTTLLRLLSCLCRRALLVGDIRAAALYQIVDSLDSTLLIDELEICGSKSESDVLRLLRTGSTRGIPAVRNGRLFSTYGFKVIASRQLPDDKALADRAAVISMLPSRKEFRTLSNEEMRRIAEKFQSRLLMFRLTHYLAVRHSRMQSCELNDMTPRARQLALVLATPLGEDPRAQADLIELLRDQDREMQVDRSLEPEWLVTDALFALWHERLPNGARYTEILVGGIASEVNHKLQDRGEDFRLTARRVGSVLKSLGIRTKWIGNQGRGLRFTQGFRRDVHKLAGQLGIDRSHITSSWGLDHGNGGRLCALCEEFGLTAGLRYIAPAPRTPRCRYGSPRVPLFDKSDLNGLDDRVNAEKP